MQAPEPVRIEIGSENTFNSQELREEDVALITTSVNPRNNLIQYELIEPITHVRNRTFFEKFLSSCVNDSRTRLTMAELKTYYKLRSDANCDVSRDNEEHNNLIRELWYSIYGEKLDEIKNNGWKVIGFQNIDPRTDFRGGALLSLKNLVYFARNNGKTIPEMSEENNDFLFGIVSINISYFLIRYYHLQDSLDYRKDKADMCSRKALKNFGNLMLSDDDTFNLIHSTLLKDVFQIWMTCKKKWSNLTIMNFKMAIETLKRKWKVATKERMHRDFEAMRSHYCSLPNDIKLEKK